MRKMKKIVSISLVLLICSPIAMGYADINNQNVEDIETIGVVEEPEVPVVPEVLKFTLKEAIEEGLKSSPQIEQSKLKVEKAEVNYKQNKYDIRENKKMLYDEKETSLNYLKGVTLLELSNEFVLKNSKIEHKIVEENLKTEIEKMYFNLVQAEKVIDINKSNVKLMKKLHEISEIKKELGMGINQEILNSKLNYTRSLEAYEQSIKNLENAKMAFNTKIGLNALQKIELLDKLEQKELNTQYNKDEGKVDNTDKIVESKTQDKLKGVENYIEQALKNRNEIKLLEFNCELERFKMDVTKKEYPDITFIYKQQVVDLEKAEETFENAKDNIELEVRSSYKQMNQKQDELNSAKQSYELAEEGLRIAQINYEVGTGVLIDVESAQNNLNQAKLGISNAILNYNLEILNFETIIGMGKSIGGM